MAERYYNLQQVVAMLRTNRMTLRDWLKDAHIDPPANPGNKKERLLTKAQVEQLAALHGRILAPVPANPTDPLVALESRLLVKIAALEQRLARLEAAMREIPPVVRQDAQQTAVPLAPLSLPFPAAPAIPAPSGVQQRYTKAYAGKLLAARHGANAKVASDWPWPASVLVSDTAILAWGLAYVQAGDWRRRGQTWRERCAFPDCPCQQQK